MSLLSTAATIACGAYAVKTIKDLGVGGVAKAAKQGLGSARQAVKEGLDEAKAKKEARAVESRQSIVDEVTQSLLKNATPEEKAKILEIARRSEKPSA